MEKQTEAGIPGLNDLLISSLALDDHKRVGQAAENVQYPVIKGIEAIGELLFSASNSDSPVDSYTLGNVGCLLKHLAAMAEMMGTFQSNAAYCEAHPEAAATMQKQKGKV